jgi:hypothetical protein
VRTRTTIKARVDQILRAAREGAHEERAAATSAYRVHLAKLCAGQDAEASTDSEAAYADAGALLDAEVAHATCKLWERYAQVHPG